MIRLFALLFGRKFLLQRWRFFGAIGILWCLLGLSIFIDAIDGRTVIHSSYFGYLLLPEASICLVCAKLRAGFVRKALLFKGAGLFIVSALIISASSSSQFLLALILSAILVVDGIFRIGSAWVVRFSNWRWSATRGVCEVLLACITLQPLPTWYAGTIGFIVGMLTFISGISILKLLVESLKVKGERGSYTIRKQPGSSSSEVDVAAVSQDLWVHIWRPERAGDLPFHQKIIGRYIAAVDRNGVISTGHAALEMGRDVYISHYPAQDIDRNSDEFFKILKATHDNDLPGRFLASYAQESSEWCSSNDRIRFTNIEAQQVKYFWRLYQEDATYNLTNRNCSNAVVVALDAAVNGILSKRSWPLLIALKLCVTPEFWIAALIRKKAESMAWTPGLLLDYARSLSVVVYSAEVNWKFTEKNETLETRIYKF
ncbi:protease [Brucella pseudogrignonensis]|uniref:protease n=1 Tax=Brucella pseudogrignonensis TaxID=419475 RepID=UPI0038CF7748